MNVRRIGLAVVIVWLVPGTLSGQLPGGTRWSVYQRFQGNVGDGAQVLKLDTGVAYALDRHWSIRAGLPFYFVRDAADPEPGFENGVGNSYVGFGFIAPEAPLDYSSSLTASVPTGDRDRGFSTGRVTLDWNNYIAKSLGRWTPFANVGVANTVSDTSFFTRPFTSLGIVGHVEGGLAFAAHNRLEIGGSTYGVLPSGEQRVVDRGRGRSRPNGVSGAGAPGAGRTFESSGGVAGDSDLARDHGVSAWMTVYPGRIGGISLGYSRSMRHDLGTVFFGIGWTR